MNDVVNFSAGPAILPQDVFKQASQDVLEYQNSGMSLLEMSHRSKEIVAMADETTALVRELLKVPDDFKILFLQGGASTQFCMVPYNLLGENETAVYFDTGSWASKAIKEARLFGKVEVAGTSADSNYNFIPETGPLTGSYSYGHFTTNNTIYGTQFKQFPKLDAPLVADMSSDIFSRPIDFEKFGVVYAGAQKNMGCAGSTLVIVREDLLGKVDRTIPSMLDYRIHIKGESMFNTPPVFAIYIANQNLQWLKKNGGVEAIQKLNQNKAQKLYQEIDSNPLFEGTAKKDSRSDMNVTFVMKDKNLEPEFLKKAGEAGLSGLKGHRSVGGFRASIYNAMPESGIDRLVACMQNA